MTSRPRLLFLVTEDWYFCSHRLPLGVAARKAGFDVTVATRVQQHGDAIRAAGLRLEPIDFYRHSHNPLRELRTVGEIVAAYRRVRPELVHHVAIKPVLYGSLAARLTHVPGVVNAIAGLGYVESSSDLRARLLRPALGAAYRGLLDRPNCRLIVQNPDDLAVLTQRRLIDPQRAALIRGSGADTQAFSPVPEPPGVPLVVLPARLLRDKGVAEFVEAAGVLKANGVQARFALVGDPDREHPGAIPAPDLRRWQTAGTVEWWGWRNDMAQVYRDCHIVCLPSYREGLPKALLEAAACGKPLVTCDVPGCREVVRNGDNGLLVPARDSSALSVALRRLIEDQALRARMGARSRERAVQEFSIERITHETLAVYRDLLQR